MIALFGCSNTSGLAKQSQLLERQSYFMAGEICNRCEQIRENPENYKDGAWDRAKGLCEDYKDFETFNKAYTNNLLKKVSK